MHTENTDIININWNPKKSATLLEERGICFEDVIWKIIKGDVIADIKNRQEQRLNQRIFVIEFDSYVIAVPYIVNDGEYFLKTIYPTRKLTEKFLKKGI